MSEGVLPSYICYACRQPYGNTLPDKCTACGESMFINVSHTIYSQEMYPDRSEPKKTEDSPPKKKLKASEKQENLEDYGMFSGFVANDQEEDVDLFGGLETEANLVTSMDVPMNKGENAFIKGEFTVTNLKMLELAGQQMPYILVAENQQTGEVKRFRHWEWTECSYAFSHALVSYESAAIFLRAAEDCHWVVSLYCEWRGKFSPTAIIIKGNKTVN